MTGASREAILHVKMSGLVGLAAYGSSSEDEEDKEEVEETEGGTSTSSSLIFNAGGLLLTM